MKDPLNVPASRGPVRRASVWSYTNQQGGRERLALAIKVTQFLAKKYPLRSDHARGQFSEANL